MNIKFITEDESKEIIRNYPKSIGINDPTQKFIVMNPSSGCTALDNTTGQCWTEDFDTKEQAIRYLNGEDPDEIRNEAKKLKVEFTVTADLDTGTLTVIVPEVFEVTNKGWSPEVRSNYSADYQERIGNLMGAAVRARFMTLAKLTKEELSKAEASE